MASANSNAEQNNSLTILFGQSSNDYFEEYSSSLDTNTKGFAYSYSMTDDLSFSVSSQKSDASGRWLVTERDNLTAYNRAETESKGFSLASSWSGEVYTFDVSFNKSEAREQSLSWLPRVVERLDSDSKVFDFSLSRSVNLFNLPEESQLSFDWSIGIQHANFDAQIIDVIGTDTQLIVTSDIQLTQLSSFVDLGLSWWLEQDKVAWAPYLNLNWNFELDTSGQQTALLSRGGDARPVNLLDGRFTDDINIPDSGDWQIGLSLLLESGWSFDLNYSQSISTEYPTEKLFASISVFF